MTESMIRAQSLTKQFKVGKETVEAVRGVDLEVAEGELVAFLGPNGAGKSTTLRMLTTLLAPTSGSGGGRPRCDPRPGGCPAGIGYIGQATARFTRSA